MKKFVLFVSALIVLGMQAVAQGVDPVIMKIAGKDITRSEFEYSLNKNVESPKQLTDKDIRDYVDLFVNYRLKVQAALDARLDTLSSFKKEFETYRDMQLRTYLYDSVYADSVARVVYETMKESVGDSDIVHVSHILLYVPQNSNKSFLDLQKARIDSIYGVLQAGADFAELARKFSDDKNTAKDGGMLPWIGPAQVIPEFRDAAYALKAGEYTRPVLSPVGYHIILMNDRKRLEPYEVKRAELIENLNERGLREDAAEHEVKRMIANANGNLTREDIMRAVQVKAEAANPNLKYLIGEYYDGLLLYEASNRMVWQLAADDEKGLKEYFDDNRDKYTWDAPRFRGYVYRARSKEMLKRIKRVLKSCKADEGIAMLKQQLPADSMKFVRVHFGVYKQGDDPIVDYRIFKNGKAPKENKVLPYYEISGKKYKRPKAVVDVKQSVVADYQTFKEKVWIEGLRKKYNYSIDEKVLSTVNKHD